MQDRFRVRGWSIYDSNYYDDIQNMLFGEEDNMTLLDAISKGLVSEIIPEQCTGLKDKNGKLIYEGDIVECDEWFGETRAYIECEKDSACYRLRNKHDSCLLSLFVHDGLETIGNIHENPELLEEN